MQHRTVSLILLAGVLLIPSVALTQVARQRQGRSRDAVAPAPMPGRMIDNIKEQLGATDDEWRVLELKIEKVMSAQREAGAAMGGPGAFGRPGGPGGPGGFGGPSAPGGPGGPGGPAVPGAPGGPSDRPAPSADAGARQLRGSDAGDRPLSKVAQTQRDLRTALARGDATAPEIAEKLAAFREARDKARTELVAAQRDLKEVVTPRQEAVLVLAGLLE